MTAESTQSTQSRTTAVDVTGATPDTLDSPELLYLDLLKKCLTRIIFNGDAPAGDAASRGKLRFQAVAMRTRETFRRLYIPLVLRAPFIHGPVSGALTPLYHATVRRLPFNLEARLTGQDWPPDAETMIGLQRITSLQRFVIDVLRREVPGDLIETGVWRGGATILMRGVLKAYGDTERTVWVADSFQGLPKPDAGAFPVDKDDTLWTFGYLAVPVEQVKANFARYGLLDEQVRFLVGWFRDTLPSAPIERLAILRLDGDMYESTMEALRALYPKLSVGGYVIVDDYHAFPPCQQAVDDFRAEHGITETLERLDWVSVWWRRER